MRIMVFMNCNRLKRTPGADRCNIETLPSRPRILRRYHWTLCALAGGRIAASAQAAMTTIKFQPNSADINDLDHRLVHTRRIDGISPGGFAVTGPTLSVGNVSRWDANPNVRHFPLLDAAINPGIDNLTSSTLADRLHPHPRQRHTAQLKAGGRRALILKTLVRLGVGGCGRSPFGGGRFLLRMRRLHDPRRRTPKHKQKNLAITHHFKLRTPKEILHAKDHLVA